VTQYFWQYSEHECTNTHKQTTKTRTAPFPVLEKQPTISATENLPVCPALQGTQASPRERKEGMDGGTGSVERAEV